MHTRPATHWLVLVLLIAAVVAAHVLVLRPGHDWGDDFAMYCLHARNLAEGRAYTDTGYLYNPSYPQVGPPTYPPITPLLLAPVYACCGLNLLALKGVMVGCFAAFVACVALTFRRELPTWGLAALVALVGLNWFFVFDTNIITSDEPFLAFLYLAFFLMEKARGPDSSPRRRLLWGVALGAAMYGAFGARTPGALLVPVLLAADLWQTRRIAASSLVAVGVFAVLATVQSLLLHSDRHYLDQFGAGPGVLAAHAVAYLGRWAAFFSNGYSKTLAAALFLAVMLLAMWGFVRRVRQGATTWEIFVVLYLAMILVWPSYEGERYLYLILPFWLFYALTGLVAAKGTVPFSRRESPDPERHQSRRENRDSPPAVGAAKSRWVRIATAVLLLAVTASYATRWATLDFRTIDEGVTSPNAVALFDHVRQHTAPDAVLVFIKPRAMALFTGRRASVYHVAPSDDELWRYFRRIGATHLVVVENDEALGRAENAAFSEYLRDFVRRGSAGLHEQYRNQDFSVYHILPP